MGLARWCDDAGVTGQPNEVQLGILGSLEVRVAGRPFPVPGPRQRALLAALLLRRGTVVPMDRLVDEVFGEAPPREARNALQTYVTRLRQSLGPAAAAVATRAPGYVLELPGDAVDAEVFAALLGRARVAEAPSAALALLDQALGLWRGPAYAEFASAAARGEALRLQELRLAAEEDRAVLLLRLDRVAEATAAPRGHRDQGALAGAARGVAGHRPGPGRPDRPGAGHPGRLPRPAPRRARPRPLARLRRLEEQVLRGTLEPVAPVRSRPRPSPAGRPFDLLRRPGTRARPGRGGDRRRTAGDAGRSGRGGRDPAGPGGRRPPGPRGGSTWPRSATLMPSPTRSPRPWASTSSRARACRTRSANGPAAVPGPRQLRAPPDRRGSARRRAAGHRFRPLAARHQPGAAGRAWASWSLTSHRWTSPLPAPPRAAPRSGCSWTGRGRPTPRSRPARRRGGR